MLKIYVDGSCRGNGTKTSIAGIGVIAYKDSIKYLSLQKRLLQPATNNEAEYMALLFALKFSRSFDEAVIIYSDSKLVIQQVTGNWKIKKHHLKQSCSMCRSILMNHSNVSLKWISRDKNTEANDLAQSITEE